MRLFDKFFKSKKQSVSMPVKDEIEHAVIIHFNYGMEEMEEIYKLRDTLVEIIEEHNLGEYDGHEIAVDYSDGYLYMYGPNAVTLFNGIKSTLENTNFLIGAKAKLRFGPPEDGIKEIIVEITEN